MISSDIEEPFVGTEIDGSGAANASGTKPKSVILAGYRLSSGTVAQGVPFLISDTGATSDLAAGRGSMLADMARNYRLVDKYTELWGVGINEPSGGTAGTQTITPAGTTTAGGTIPLYIADERVPVDVSSGANPAAMAAAMAAAITARDHLPVTAAAVDDVVTVTARHKGAYEIKIHVGGYVGDALPAGCSAVVVAAGASAAGLMDVSVALTGIAGRTFDRLVLGVHTDAILDSVEADLAARWAPLDERDGMAFYAHAGASVGTITTYTTAPARNSAYGACVAPPSETFAAPVWRVGAMVAAIDMAEALVNTPRQWIVLPGVRPGTGIPFTLPQRSTLIKAGASTLKVDASGNVCVSRLVTTYQKNGAGASDPIFRDVATMAALSYARWAWRTRIQRKHPRSLLGNDGAVVAPGIPLVTPLTIRAEGASFHAEMSDLGIFDSSSLQAFLDALRATRPNGDPHRVNAIMSPLLLAQFLKLGTTIRPQL